ncbi:hypothetical protein ACFSO7_02845 [Bacillus sp. CGMCC 1.16607]|uniref:hypothetical protein n=1 Tax=Bacillus sp. CGMCC 1.16607 TaxID=3351842 RepID=UPI0036288583
MLTKKEVKNLEKYASSNSGSLVKIYENIEGKFNILPIRSSASFKGDKLVSGERVLAELDTREEAESALINICGYSKGFIDSLSQ